MVGHDSVQLHVTKILYAEFMITRTLNPCTCWGVLMQNML